MTITVAFVEIPRAMARAGINERMGQRYGIFSKSHAKNARVPIFVNPRPKTVFTKWRRRNVRVKMEKDKIICHFAHLPTIEYASLIIVSYSGNQFRGTNERTTYATRLRSIRKNMVSIVVVVMRNVVLATETNIPFPACKTFVALPEMKETIWLVLAESVDKRLLIS